ncbi:triose-phosphate isomerase [Moheibacter stercoris]|uniref:Triosephosphate isomerase n=1 Tax=Moheibacter stercoris TaxID=1628251 RepID=A0ABV2LSZ7_9FLAO
MRRKIVAGNWKMNLTFPQARELALHLNTWVNAHKPNAEIIIAPTHLYLEQLNKDLKNSRIRVASQNVSAMENGAYTGDVSAEQLLSIGTKISIVGHSERRAYHHEVDKYIGMKISHLYKKGMSPILCVGEKLEDRESGKHFDVVKEQLNIALERQNPEDLLRDFIVAYEPVWAIGTGKTASPDQAQEMHDFIRKTIGNQHGLAVANATSILYGGSVNAGNARDLFEQYDIDGALVGGASLKLEDFTTIINARG